MGHRPTARHPDSEAMARPGLVVATAVAAVSLGAAGCGGGDGGGGEPAVSPAPAASDFPPANGRTLDADPPGLRRPAIQPGGEPHGRGLRAGREPLRLRRLHRLARAGGRRPGRDLRRAQRRGQGHRPVPGSDREPRGQAPVRVADDRPGPRLGKGRLRHHRRARPRGQLGPGRRCSARAAVTRPALIPTIKVGGSEDIPTVGERPPRIHTPTVSDVGGDLGQIDTRSPHDDMHKVDFADVLGKEPVVLLFATPALCESRVCGPVVDVAEQVEHEAGDGVNFIHMEVFNNNNASDGYRPQLLEVRPADRAVGVRDRSQGHRAQPDPGRLRASELENAVRQVAG